MPSPYTVTCTLNDPSGTALTDASFVRFRLRNFQGFVPQVQGTSVVCETQIDALPNGSGQVSQALWGNNQITPATTFYTVEYHSNGRITSSGNYLIDANTDLDTAPQVNAPPVPAGFELVLEHNSILNSSQSTLNLENTDGSITITDVGSGTLNLTTSAGAGATAAFMISAGIFSSVEPYVFTTGQITDSPLRVYGAMFTTPHTLSFNELAFEGNSSLLQGGDLAFAIYSESGTLLWTSATAHIPNTAGQVFTQTFSNFPTLAPGTYYLAWTATANTSAQGMNVTMSPTILNSAGLIIFGYCSTLATETGGLGGTIVFPSSLGTLNAATNSSLYAPGVIFT